MALRTRGGLAALAAVGLASSVASGEIIEHRVSVDLERTDWDKVLSVPLFDPNLGFLQKIDFELTGKVKGDAQFESLDTEPATVRMNLASQVRLARPNGSTLVVTLPVVATEDDVDAFDGIIDFGGASGRSYLGVSAEDFESSSTTDPGDFALFTGIGSIDLLADARGRSEGSGAGNLVLQFMTTAGAEVLVRYHYVIPAPGALALLGLGGLFAVRRRR